MYFYVVMLFPQLVRWNYRLVTLDDADADDSRNAACPYLVCI